MGRHGALPEKATVDAFHIGLAAAHEVTYLLTRNRKHLANATMRGGVRSGMGQRVTVNPAVRSGKPCIKGTRITVYDILEYLAGGMSEDEVLTDLPDLTREDVRAALAFAAARERRLANSVA